MLALNFHHHADSPYTEFVQRSLYKHPSDLAARVLYEVFHPI